MKSVPVPEATSEFVESSGVKIVSEGLSVCTIPSPRLTVVPARSSAVPPLIVVASVPIVTRAPVCNVTPALNVSVLTPLSTSPASSTGVVAVTVWLPDSSTTSPALTPVRLVL